ncbi:hypothetical protein [Coraliomargarita parva]|uniref:hypothetical protein n=1 Tax=Coraliomargarita parva TaxID=3014050 RepID=UPI0022B4F8F3|nr:hypothetical protein [Coraliomargarita parva]
MGLFDKVKSMANAITGNAAKVTVSAAPVAPGQPVALDIQALAKDATVAYSRVYVKIRGRETIDLHDRDGNSTERIRRHENTFEMETVVDGAGELAANESKTWSCEVTIPSTAPAFYRGKYAEHFYEVQVGLDCAGNDPDSGWVRLQSA